MTHPSVNRRPLAARALERITGWRAARGATGVSPVLKCRATTRHSLAKRQWHTYLKDAVAALAAITLALVGVAAAQDNPFDDLGGAPPDAVAPAAPAADDAAAEAPAAPPAAAPPAAPPDAAALADAARRSPAVAAVLDLPRASPAEKLRAVTMLVDLGQTETASLLLPELLAAPLDDAARAALVREFGPARFMKLIRLDAPAAPGPLAGLRAFAQSCLDAAAAEAADPARLAQLIAGLQAPGEDDRYAAQVDLRATGDPGVVAALEALAAAEGETARANIMAALAQMRPAVDEPLLAVLADGQGAVRRDAAELAGHLRLHAALPLLASIASSADASSADASAAGAARTALAKLGKSPPTPAETQTLLRAAIAAAATAPPTAATDDAGGRWWSWDAASRRLAAANFSEPQLRLLAAARLARALAALDAAALPDDRRAAVIYGLEEAALLGREPAEPLRQSLALMTAAEVSGALARATGDRHDAAAAQLAAELGRRGDATVLATTDGRPAPLAAALLSSDRELRFAALAAIMELAPQRSFPGASHVPAALWHFVAGAGEPTALTASPDVVEANDWAAQLRGRGFDAAAARRGRDALAAVLDPALAARLAVVVLDSDLGDPPLGEVVYQLHTNESTAGVPILIAASVGRLDAAARIAEADPLVLAAPRPHGDGALAALVDRALTLARRPLPTVERRSEQAAQALAWLAKLLADGSPYDELPRHGALVHRTLLVPELSAPSIAVLAALGTAESQLALLDYASAYSLPIDGRRAAAAAFAANVQRHGLHITRDQRLRQYDRYNASETADVDTQRLLGQILDVIENKPRPVASGQ